ncbi:unnamed protein product [Victoria cruziana]
MVHLLMGERWGLKPCVVDSQSTALIHLATSAPTPGPSKASNKEVGLFIDLTSLYLRLKIWVGRAVIKALALHSGHIILTSRRVARKALFCKCFVQSSLLRALCAKPYVLIIFIGLVGNMPKALECHPARAMNWREDHQQIMHCSTHHLLGCHRPGDNQYEAVASPSIELHHHISDDRISKCRIKTRNGWKSLSDGAGTAVD